MSYTSPIINTSAIMDRQAATLQTNLQNITAAPAPTTNTGTFWDKVNTFLDKVSPVVDKVQTVVSQTRVPGTSLPYNPQLQMQQNNRPNYTPVLVGAGLLLTGFLIYKAVK